MIEPDPPVDDGSIGEPLSLTPHPSRLVGVEPKIIHPPLHQYVTRDWRFWAAVAAAAMALASLLGVVLTRGTNVTLKESNTSLTETIDVLITRVADLAEAGECRSIARTVIDDASATVSLELARMEVASSEQQIVQAQIVAQAVRGAVPDELANELDQKSDVLQVRSAALALAASRLDDAVRAQIDAITACSEVVTGTDG